MNNKRISVKMCNTKKKAKENDKKFIERVNYSSRLVLEIEIERHKNEKCITKNK